MQKRLQPMHDRPFACEMREWFAGWEAWERGERPDMTDHIETQSQRVARAQAALVARGGRRIGGYLQPEAAQALAALAQAGYGKNQVDIVSRALLDAQRRISKAKPATL